MSDSMSESHSAEMHVHSEDEIRGHVRKYIFVFIGLAILTVFTVGVSYLHLPIGQAVAVALVIAAIKGSLVMSFFMHLIDEKAMIKWALILTAFMFLVLMVLPVITIANNKVV